MRLGSNAQCQFVENPHPPFQKGKINPPCKKEGWKILRNVHSIDNVHRLSVTRNDMTGASSLRLAMTRQTRETK
jgi:hypothetical protein